MSAWAERVNCSGPSRDCLTNDVTIHGSERSSVSWEKAIGRLYCDPFLHYHPTAGPMPFNNAPGSRVPSAV